jgi:uncharacterized protein (DUF305 family)
MGDVVSPVDADAPPADPPVEGPPDEVDEDEESGGPSRPGLSWPKVAVVGLAMAFLGFAVAVVATQDRAPAADSVDVGFIQDMLTHHDQAIQMARVTLAYGEDPVVNSYAQDVLADQSYETGVMTRMLGEWGYTRDDRSDEAMAWMGMAVPVAQMPGLLSDEEMAELKAALGRDVDRLFLERMAEHHRGGIHMAEAAAGTAGSSDVRELAQRMAHNQAGEIDEYRQTDIANGYGIGIEPASVPPADLP